MNKGMIKISHTQWLASGIEKGYVIPEEDGTFTLNKKAQWQRALGAAVGSALKNPYVKSGLIGAGIGGLASLVSRSNLLEAAQDWWKGGSETPEMLKSLQEAKARFEQEVVPRLVGISDRLDKNIADVRSKLDERIQTITQRLGERGLGPAFEKGRQLLLDDQMMDEMTLAAQKPPLNYDTISGMIRGGQSAPAPQPAATPAPQPGATPAPTTAATPAPAAAPAPQGGGGTGGADMLEQMLAKGGT